MSADQRRRHVLDVALREFARGGLDGTSTEAIAARAGISQPYLFRLFPTKKSLFLAAIREGFSRVATAFENAADGLTGEKAMMAMGESYDDLLRDRDLLLAQLQAYAACDDPEVCSATRTSFQNLWQLVARISGEPDEVIAPFFAKGMLMNVAAAMNFPELNTDWARSAIDFACPPSQAE